jgi:transcriptional regulator with XRE-family HTH domain
MAVPSKIDRQAGLRIFKNMGLAIRALRELSGQKQAVLARRSGIGKGQLSKYETGKDLPRLESLGKLLIALNVSVEVFFKIVALLDRIESGSNALALPGESDPGPLISEEEREAFRVVQRDLLHLYELQIAKRIMLTKRG